mgnify:CR=1 FL=1
MGNIFSSKSFISRYGPAKTGEIEVASSDGPAKTKGERQKGRADKKAARQQERAKKRIDRNEGKQARIKKNTQSSSDPAVRASGKARIKRAQKRVEKNRTVAKDYKSKLDKKTSEESKKTINTKFKGGKIGDKDGDGKIDVNLVKDSKKSKDSKKPNELLTVRQIAAAKEKS